MIAISPVVTGWSAQSLVVHHFAHWLMVAAGALVGYRLSDRMNPPGRQPAAWLGLGLALAWHFPPALAWAESTSTLHMLAHATLVIAGGAVGWAVPRLSDQSKAFLFIAGNVAMWPIVLAELVGAVSYPDYQGQSSAAGVAEMIGMSSTWLVLAFWTPLRKLVGRAAVAITLQFVMVGLLVLDWAAR